MRTWSASLVRSLPLCRSAGPHYTPGHVPSCFRQIPPNPMSNPNPILNPNPRIENSQRCDRPHGRIIGRTTFILVHFRARVDVPVSEMTYTVSGGTLNPTQPTNQPTVTFSRCNGFRSRAVVRMHEVGVGSVFRSTYADCLLYTSDAADE